MGSPKLTEFGASPQVTRSAPKDTDLPLTDAMREEAQRVQQLASECGVVGGILKRNLPPYKQIEGDVQVGEAPAALGAEDVATRQAPRPVVDPSLAETRALWASFSAPNNWENPMAGQLAALGDPMAGQLGAQLTGFQAALGYEALPDAREFESSRDKILRLMNEAASASNWESTDSAPSALSTGDAEGAESQSSTVGAVSTVGASHRASRRSGSSSVTTDHGGQGESLSSAVVYSGAEQTRPSAPVQEGSSIELVQNLAPSPELIRRLRLDNIFINRAVEYQHDTCQLARFFPRYCRPHDSPLGEAQANSLAQKGHS